MEPAQETGYEPYRHINAEESLLQRSSPPPVVRVRSNRRFLAARVVLRVFSTLMSLAVVGVMAHTIVAYEASKNMRMVWDHNLALKAFPTNGANLVPAYFILGTAGLVSLLNIIALVASIRQPKSRQSKSFSSFSAGLSHLVAIGVWVAALILFKLGKNDFFTWSCRYRAVEAATKSNAVGLSVTCVEMTAVFAVGILVGAIEVFNLLLLFFDSRSDKRIQHITVQSMYRPRVYQRVDKAASDHDIPMLEQSRKSMT